MGSQEEFLGDELHQAGKSKRRFALGAEHDKMIDNNLIKRNYTAIAIYPRISPDGEFLKQHHVT